MTITRFNEAATWLEDMWVNSLVDFTKVYKSVLPYTFYVAQDKQTAKFEMALAGFSASDLEVTYSNEGILSVKTNKLDKNADSVNYIHKGIANRFIQFSLPIYSSYVIKDASMKDGLLAINFERINSKSDPVKVVLKTA